MATVNGRDSVSSRTRLALGIRKAPNYNLNASGKRTRLAREKYKAPERNLSSDLWAALPECLVEEILAKLPFSSLVRLRSVSKRWRDRILYSGIAPRCTSDRGHLFFFSNEKLVALNSRRKTWETVPLQFLQMHVKLLDVVSSAGGLLCFSTTVIGEYVVCNPLTKSFKRLQMPCSAAGSTSDQPCMPIGPTLSDVLFFRGHSCEPADLIRAFLVGMVLHSDTGHFKLIVAGLFPSSGATTLVYDSHSNNWKNVANIPEDVPNNICPWTRPGDMRELQIVCGGNFYVYFRQTDCIADRLFKYDVEQQEWVSILLPQVCVGVLRNGENIIEYDGKILLVTSKYRDNAAQKSVVFELQETAGSNLWTRKDRPPFSRVCEAMSEKRTSNCLGQGNVMLILREHNRPELPRSDLNNRKASRYSMKVSVREFFHNVSTKSFSEVFLKWSKPYKHDVMFPDLRIFRPSLLSFK